MTYEDLKSGKVKLEFGNSEQITLIDKNQEMKRLNEIEEDDSVKKVYEAEFAVSGTAIIQVISTNEDDAKEEARDTVWRGDIDDYDFELINIKLVEEAIWESQ